MRVLLVEDEGPKRQHIQQFCEEVFPELTVDWTGSVRGATDFLTKTTPDLILLDMSLPTFQIGAKEKGGRPQGTGGIEVIRFIDMMDLRIPIVVVTAYPAISIEGRQHTLEEIDLILKTDHQLNYCGLVYFNSVYSTWRSDLEALLKKLGIET